MHLATSSSVLTYSYILQKNVEEVKRRNMHHFPADCQKLLTRADVNSMLEKKRKERKQM